MKKLIKLYLIVMISFIASSINAQGYFVASAGNYVSPSNFNTNVQKDVSKYDGKYIAVSESYESNFTLVITPSGKALNIVFIYSSTLGIEDNWSQDTTIYKDVIVKDGKFSLDLNVLINSEISGIKDFRFVKCTYKQEGGGKNIKSEGVAWEEFHIFGEKER